MFFIAFLEKGGKSIALFTISTVLFIITAVSSVNLDVIIAGQVQSYAGNAPLGLLSLGFAVVSGGLALSRLEDII